MTPTRPTRSQDRTRILQVCGSAAGGVRTHLADCARLLAADGHDVIVEAPSQVLAGADVGAARAEALHIGPLPSPTDARALVRLRRLGHRADVVHAHGLRAGALAALALGRRRSGRTRLVVTVHNLPVGGRATTTVGNRLESLMAARADHILTVSPDLAERLRARGAPTVEIAVVPAPVRAKTSLRPESAGGGEVLGPSSTEDPWAGAGAKVLTVARLAPQKGLDLLLEAAALLASGNPAGSGATTLCWAVAGEGPGRAQAEARIEAESLPVTLLGRREDVGALMEAADVLVQTSLWEGQPLTIQEALRAGAAIVATDVGGTALTARGAARLVPPEPRAVAEAVAGLLADPRARAAAGQRSRVAAAQLPGDDELAAQLRAVLLPA